MDWMAIALEPRECSVVNPFCGVVVFCWRVSLSAGVSNSFLLLLVRHLLLVAMHLRTLFLLGVQLAMDHSRRKCCHSRDPSFARVLPSPGEATGSRST